tara:strand:- start:267 stop:1742 length:1476 start_codon:yes stop_codon:yes gene_type:complete
MLRVSQNSTAMLKTQLSDEIQPLVDHRLLPKIDKTPLFCGSPTDLQAGDIVIFGMRPPALQDEKIAKKPRRKDVAGNITVFQQGFLNEKGGHKDSVHAGFIVMNEGQLMFAHLVGEGFLLKPIKDIYGPGEHEAGYFKSTTHVYRPRKNGDKLAAELVKLLPVMQSVDHQKNNLSKVKWKFSVGLRSVFHRIFQSLRLMHRNPAAENFVDKDVPKERVIANASICSKLVADAYIHACHNLTLADADNFNYRARYMNISSFTLPKTLQAYLYRNVNYEYLVMPNQREEVYDKLVEVVKKEVSRLVADGNIANANHKGEELEAILNADRVNDSPDEDVMQKSINLLKKLSPVLLRNTRGHKSTPTSYWNVMLFAKSQGLYAEYLGQDLHDRKEGKITNLAKEHYGYSDKQAKQYSQFRRIGFSDEEAKFECQAAPTLGDWFKLSPVRNTVISCTGVGFLFWVLPRGLSCAASVRKRNQELLIVERDDKAVNSL